MKDVVLRLLEERGVKVTDIAQIVAELCGPDDVPLEECVRSVETVIGKREAQHAILTGIALDVLAERNGLPEPLNAIVRRDEPLYGVDEILALGITNLYGSVGLTSFGYLDKRKLGIIGKLNSHRSGQVHTFLDDLVAGIAAAAAARVAHQRAGVGPSGPDRQAASG
ncbi:MAG: phosphatidylglycerophosphatase A [Firmicutes bacterium]|nr:phosphatidylglycerophosphatase A [Bacillota bacterium]